MNRNSLSQPDPARNNVIDFNAGGDIEGTPLGDLDFEGESGAVLEVGADSIQLELFDVLFVDAGFTFSEATVDVDVNGNGLFSTTEQDLDDATLLKFSLTVNQLFAGIPDEDPFAEPIGGTGFSVQNGTLALAVIKANANIIPGDDRSYTAVKANFTGPIQMVGLPDGLTAVASDLRVALNGAEGTLGGTPTAINWVTSVNEDGNSVNNQSFDGDADAIDFRNGSDELIETIGEGFEGELASIGGTLDLDVFGYLQANATFDLTRRAVDVDVDNDGFGPADASDPSDDLVNASLLTVDLELNDLFIGVPDTVGIVIGEGAFTLALLRANAETSPADDRVYTALLTSVSAGTFIGIPSVDINVVRLMYETNMFSGSATGPLAWQEVIDLQPNSDPFEADEVLAGDTVIDPDTFLLSGELNLSIDDRFCVGQRSVRPGHSQRSN